MGRALAELGIGSIPAGSPQAKGRIERCWGTTQGRLPLLLRRAGADDRLSANAVLADWLPRFNAAFTVPAADPVPAWRPLPEGLDLAAICAFRYERVIANDATVRVGGLCSTCRASGAVAASRASGWRCASSSTVASSWPMGRDRCW